MTYFQQSNGNVYLTDCSHKLGCNHYHGSVKIFWAWDRTLNAWVHYV